MAAPTITVNSVIFTFNEGDVEEIENSLACNLDFDSMPMSGPAASLLFDLSGVTKTITLRGRLSNSGTTRLSSGTAITLNEQRQWLELNLQGNQTAGSFDSNYTSTYDTDGWYASSFLFSTIRFSEKTGDPQSIYFDITLFVGDA